MALDTTHGRLANDGPPEVSPEAAPFDLIGEARRQVEICNACRYCEGYCAVFPAITRETAFADGDITQLANLCHNCRGCYYACQYTPPHDFALNLPKALGEVRVDSWNRFAWPNAFAGLFQRSGTAIAAALVVGLALLFMGIAAAPDGGEGFYAHMGHNVMVAIFAPAFLFPLFAIGMGLRAYWREVGGHPVTARDILHAIRSAASMRNLSGGQGQGCNFEREERYTDLRRYAHQAAMWGFFLCFLSTSSGTVLHYFFDWQAPYPWWSPPKLLGVPGGIALVAGTLGLAWLKTRADPQLNTPATWGGDMAYVLLLAFSGASGLALYWLPAWTGTLLAFHLGSVLTLFLLTPYSKMAHGFFRMAALTRDAQVKTGRRPIGEAQSAR